MEASSTPRPRSKPTSVVVVSETELVTEEVSETDVSMALKSNTTQDQSNQETSPMNCSRVTLAVADAATVVAPFVKSCEVERAR